MQPQKRAPKLFARNGHLPTHIDPARPPSNKPPWRQIDDVPFVSCASMVLPTELFDFIRDMLQGTCGKPTYAKAILKLQDLLDGDFFDAYVKRGNILLLSEGQPGADNVFWLHQGILNLDLDKPSYERTGLQGLPVPSGGRKHVKNRYRIEIDLRQKSMQPGKNGFERIVWAAKNVLNHSLVWLFHDPEHLPETSSDKVSPINAHHPTWTYVQPQISRFESVNVPLLASQRSSTNNSKQNTEDEDIYDLVEWLDLVAIASPRVLPNDTIDPYLCRYSPPQGPTQKEDLTAIYWTGFMASEWVAKLLSTVINESRRVNSQAWLAFSATAYRTEAIGQHDGYTILLNPANDDTNTTTAQDSNDIDLGSREPASEDGKIVQNPAGLRVFRCFEHVDSVER